MQKKKTPKADIGRNSSLYFALGLATMMFLSYGSINYKAYDKDALGLDKVSMDALDEEEVPVTEQVKPPPPPPPHLFRRARRSSRRRARDCRRSRRSL